MFLRAVLQLFATNVLLISLILATTMASPIRPLSTSRRWIYPCSGRHPVIHSTEVAADDVTHAPIDLATTVTETVDLISTFRALSKSAKRLKRRVGELKTLYVRHVVVYNYFFFTYLQMKIRGNRSPNFVGKHLL